MVDDYLSDREQEEALRTWWRENWKWIIAGVALGLGLLGGWRYWETHKVRRAQAASTLYADFEAARAQKDLEKAARLLADLADQHDESAYTQQGRLMLAKDQAEAGKLDEAIALLHAAAEGTADEELAQVARLRTARLQIQLGKHDDALKLLDAQKAGAFAGPVHELRGDALLAKGDTAGARSEYAAALAAEPGAPIDRTMVELKLGEVAAAQAQSAPAAEGEPAAPPAATPPEAAPTTGQP